MSNEKKIKPTSAERDSILYEQVRLAYRDERTGALVISHEALAHILGARAMYHGLTNNTESRKQIQNAYRTCMLNAKTLSEPNRAKSEGFWETIQGETTDSKLAGIVAIQKQRTTETDKIIKTHRTNRG